MKTQTYKLKDTRTVSLKKNGWHYAARYSNADESYYTYSFPVYKHNGLTLIYCEFIVSQNEHKVDIEVYTINEMPYAPFYDDKYSTNNLVLIEVEERIRRKMRKLCISKQAKTVKNVNTVRDTKRIKHTYI